jgi:membrane protease YdiL (CAAX protease family)
MTGHLRIKSPNTQLGVLLLIYFLPQFILAAVGQGIIPVNPDLSNRETLNYLKWIQAISSLVFFLLPAILFSVITFRGRYLHFLGFRNPERSNMYILGIACMLLAFPLVFWLGELNQRIPLPSSIVEMEKQAAKQIEGFLKISGPADLFINVIIIALLPAVCEEMFFRGAMQRVIIHLTKRPWAGIIVTAALFSALHFQFQGFMPRMFLGVILGALYWFSGSIWTSIVAHFVTNAIQVIAASYATEYISENPKVPVYLALASSIAVFGILRLYQKQSTITWPKVYDRNGLTAHNNYIS